MDKITVYTDGSKFPKYTHIGLGAYCMYKGNDYRLSVNLEQDLFVQWSGSTEKVSNPTAELGAASAVLYEFTFCKMPVHIEIVADYIGVKKWCEKSWQANRPYIQKFLEGITHQTNLIRKNGGEVSYRHIHGHQKGNSPDVLGNNQSDKMAKSLEDVNEFKHLIQLINGEY